MRGKDRGAGAMNMASSTRHFCATARRIAVRRGRRPVVGILVWATVLVPSLIAAQTMPTTASQTPAPVPQVVVVVQVPTTDLLVSQDSYRVFYLKTELKYIPVSHYDFAVNLTDELLYALSEDKRADWRASKPEESLYFAAYFDPAKVEEVKLPSTIPADRLLLVEAKYSAHKVSLRKRVMFWLEAKVRMVDRSAGKIVWKKGFHVAHFFFPLEELQANQADDQKGIKEALNKLMEELVAKIKNHTAQSKL